MGFSGFPFFSLFFVLVVLTRAQEESDLLEFVPVDGANTEENVYLTDNRPEVSIDATSKITRSIYFLGSTSLVIHVVRFACEVSRRSAQLTQLKLCCGSGENFACHRLSAKPSSDIVTCNRIQFNYDYDPHRGANFTLSFTPHTNHRFPYNELIYCEVQDSEATIQSNVIDLRDATFYANQLGVAPSNDVDKTHPSEVSPLDFPLKFSCGDYSARIRDWPSWMAAVWQQYLSPFEWAYCRVGEATTPVGCAKDSKILGVGDGVTTMDGNLFLLSYTLLANNPNIAFVCLKRGSTSSPIRVFAGDYQLQATPQITKGFTLNSNITPNYMGGFEAISPLSSVYQFVEGTVLSDFNLLAFYRVPQSARPNFHTGWYKDGVKLTDPEATTTSFRLPNKVERSFAGFYELRVMEGAALRLKFTFTVSVVGPPTFKNVNCVEDLFYALEGTSKTFVCQLNARKGEAVDFRVGINGFEAATAEQLKALLSSSLQLQNQPVNQLDINFWQLDPQADSTKGVTVEVRDLTMGQNFRLSVKASNAYGQSLVAGTLRVVPKPALQISPSRASCTADCGEEAFDVHCVPTASVLQQWANLNIVQHQGWVLARALTMEMVMDDPDLAKYFVFNATQPSTVRVSPYRAFAEGMKTSDLPTSPSTLASPAYSSTAEPRETLQDVLAARVPRVPSTLLLECRFQLFVNNSRAKFVAFSFEPPSESSARRKREVMDEQKKIYDSYNEADETLKETLAVKRSLSEAPKPASANLAWVAAVIIAIIFILIVIIVSVWLCTRNRGETYKLSKKEYKLGNDPLRELKEKETFQTYERPEEPPSLASGMEEPGLEVGSDEDGELDAYNMDPGTFNEEASFIGQYSSPSRTAGYRDHHTVV